jgi:hypothetical protein
MTEEYEEEDDGIIEVPLGDSGLISWIDEEDEELLSGDWRLKTAGSKEFPHYYAIRRWKAGRASGEYYLHNEVWERMLGAPLPRGFLIDHINGDKLDNRRANLRLATRSDNEANKRKRRTQAGGKPSSSYKGVSKITDGRKKCWRATITQEHRHINLGTYYVEEDAAAAYDKAAVEYFGEFASINDLPEKSK